MGKGLLNKLKLGFAGLSLIGASYFNSVKAQEEDSLKCNNTIVHKMLQVEDGLKLDIKKSTNGQKWTEENFKAFPSLQTLDSLIDESKCYIKQKDNYTKKDIEKISENIYSNILKKFPNIKEREKIDLCYRTSLIYLAIGQTNNLPFYGVVVRGVMETPSHMFVRYDSDGMHDPVNPGNLINKEDINIETTTGKVYNDSIPDDSLVKKFIIFREDLKGTDYLKNLDEDELLSLAYLYRSKKYFDSWVIENDTRKGFIDLDKAIQLNPNFFEAYNLKAAIYMHKTYAAGGGPVDKEAAKKAIYNYKTSLEIYPYLESLNNKARLLYKEFEEYGEVIKECTKGINILKKIGKERYLDLPDDLKEIYLSQSSSFYFKRALAYEKIGEREKYEKDYDDFQFYEYQGTDFGAILFMDRVNRNKNKKIE